MYQRPANPSSVSDSPWLTLPDSLLAPRAAREHLSDAHLSTSTATLGDLHLLVSELVTNAVVHGRPVVAMRVTVAPETIRVEVSDLGGPLRWTVPVLPPASRPSGRGLAIVDSIATRWGIDPADAAPGKTVWIEFDLVPVT